MVKTMHDDVRRVAEMAWRKRDNFWASHQQASSDYWRNMFGIMAEAWGEVAREIDPDAEAVPRQSEDK